MQRRCNSVRAASVAPKMCSILLAAMLAAQARGFAGENTGQQSVEARAGAGESRKLQSVISDANIYDAVDAWLDDKTAAEAVYGHISTWDVSAVTSMKQLFCGRSTCWAHYHSGAASFNEDISGWDARRPRGGSTGPLLSSIDRRSRRDLGADVAAAAGVERHGYVGYVRRRQSLRPAAERVGRRGPARAGPSSRGSTGGGPLLSSIDRRSRARPSRPRRRRRRRRRSRASRI